MDQNKIGVISDQLEEMLSVNQSPLFSALTSEDGGKTVMLSANQEGLVYFASILLSLANSQSEGQHFHFDINTVLDRADYNLILKYVKAQ
jgi:hypothetical protein